MWPGCEIEGGEGAKMQPTNMRNCSWPNCEIEGGQSVYDYFLKGVDPDFIKEELRKPFVLQEEIKKTFFKWNKIK